MNKKGILGNLMIIGIIGMVGIMLIPTIIQEIGGVCKEQLNISSVGNTFLCTADGDAGKLFIIFFVLGGLMIGVGLIFNMFRSVGYDGGEYYDTEDDDSEDEDENDDADDYEDEDCDYDDEDDEEDEIEEDEDIEEQLGEPQEEPQKEERVVHKKW